MKNVSLKLDDAMIEFREGRLDANSLAIIATPVLKRLSRKVSSKLGLEAEDLTSEMWPTFIGPAIQKYDREKPAIPFLYEFVKRVGLSMIKLKPKELSLSSFNVLDGAESDDDISDFISIDHESFEVNYESETDQRNALEKIASRMYSSDRVNTSLEERTKEMTEEVVNISSKPVGAAFVNESALGKVSDVQEGPTYSDVLKAEDRPAKKKKALAPENQLIVDAKKSLNKTNPDFARDIGIKVDALSSYLYGRAKPPKHVLDQVKHLLEEGKPQIDRIKMLEEKYGKMKMSEILKGWAKGMGVDYEETSVLADLLKTTVVTICRWKSNSVRPDNEELARYEALGKKNANNSIEKLSKM